MRNIEHYMPIKNEQDLEKILQTNDTCFILFYAEWCAFSQKFLPIYQNCTKDTTHTCYRMMIAEYPHLCERYSIDVYPTVLFFKKGNEIKLEICEYIKMNR